MATARACSVCAMSGGQAENRLRDTQWQHWEGQNVRQIAYHQADFKTFWLRLTFPVLTFAVWNKTMAGKPCNAFKYLIKLYHIVILLDFPGLLSVNQALYGTLSWKRIIA